MTGEQLEIRHGAARAIINSAGAGLRAFEVNGVPYSETYGADETPPLGSGAVLVPWPNRVAGAVWIHDGDVLKLEATEAARGNAIHGLVRRSTWTVTEHAEESVTLGIEIDGADGWPFSFATTVSYTLDHTGLTITHTVSNTGTAAMPFGVGTHPYPRPGNTDVDDCELVLAATTVLPVDADTMIPNGAPVEVDGTSADFRSGRALKGVELDTAFGGCEPGADGLVRHAIRHVGGPSVEVWAEPVFRWVQAFTPAEFPGKGARAVAIEPMTCPPDALNSGTDLITLSPGETWSGRWGITPVER